MRTPEETIEHVLRFFDRGEKLRLAEMVVTSLDIQEGDDVVEKAASLLKGRKFSDEEIGQLRLLVRFYFSRRPPEGFGEDATKLPGTA